MVRSSSGAFFGFQEFLPIYVTFCNMPFTVDGTQALPVFETVCLLRYWHNLSYPYPLYTYSSNILLTYSASTGFTFSFPSTTSYPYICPRATRFPCLCLISCPFTTSSAKFSLYHCANMPRIYTNILPIAFEVSSFSVMEWS